MDQEQAEAELERKLARVRWCCQGFSGLYEHGQNRSMFAVLVFKDSPVRFAIQCRSVDAWSMGSARQARVPFSLSLVTERMIECCPTCGRNLDTQYRDQVGALEAIHPVTTERAESLRQPISDVLREEIGRRFSPEDQPRVTAALEEVGFLSDRELLAAVVLGSREGSGLWEALLRVQFERDVVLGKTGMDKDDWLELARNDTFTLPFKLPRG